MKLIFALLLLSIFSFASVHSSLTPGDNHEILNAMNYQRRNTNPTGSNIRELIWSECLSGVALAYQQSCSGNSNPNRQTLAAAAGCMESSDSVGETVYTSDSISNFTYVVKNWSMQSDYYNYTDNTCMSVCDDYVQLVWAGTSYVGCSLYGQAACGSTGKILTCYYAKGSNPTVRPYTEGTACSGCTGSWSECRSGLCIPTSAAPTNQIMLLLVIASLLTFLLASL